MKISEYKNFIKLFPTENSGYKVKKQNWKSSLDNETLKQIFFEKDDVILTKNKIRKEKDLKIFIIKTLMWGYPTKGRGNNIDNLLKEKELNKLINVLENFKELNIITFEDLLNIEKIEGLGVSTLTKFLHLLNIKIKEKDVEYECLILDDKIFNILNESDFEELRELRTLKKINRNSVFKDNNNYLDYLIAIDKIAKENDTKPENIEMFLFFFGRNLF